MKALILAAGFGTRLRPYTESIPKPLFPVNGHPLLDTMIRNLVAAGCEAILVNTHHLADQIDAFLAAQSYGIPVITRYEPEIRGTGGAIQNAADFWDQRPFIVANSDIITDLDFAELYAFHTGHACPVTLALCNDPDFNTVSVTPEGLITGFNADRGDGAAIRRKTFTGLQVLDPAVLAFIPQTGFSNSIDAFRQIIAAGHGIKAFCPNTFFWQDIGTPERFRQASLNRLVSDAFTETGTPDTDTAASPPAWCRLKGDGSDRTWYRISRKDRSVILADHGIRQSNTVTEADAFVALARHLHQRGLPVPKVLGWDTFSGLVLLEDLGDTHFQALVNHSTDRHEITGWYESLIDVLIRFSIDGARGFDPGWAFQTPVYDRQLILERECRYFVEAFLNGYLDLQTRFEELADEFSGLAGTADANAYTGLMHRDLQSRNVMVKGGKLFLIDFQGGRIGPLQYDLASLLIDPYVRLPQVLQDRLLTYAAKKYAAAAPCRPERFMAGYRACRLARNLQILGAFGHLSRFKQKTVFQQYIPPAVETLLRNLSSPRTAAAYPKLLNIVHQVHQRLFPRDPGRGALKTEKNNATCQTHGKRPAGQHGRGRGRTCP